MAEGESVFPQDIAWLLGHSVLAEAVAGVGTREQAEREYKTLLPYAGRIPNLAMVATAGGQLVAGHAGSARQSGLTQPPAHFSDVA